MTSIQIWQDTAEKLIGTDSFYVISEDRTEDFLPALQIFFPEIDGVALLIDTPANTSALRISWEFEVVDPVVGKKYRMSRIISSADAFQSRLSVGKQYLMMIIEMLEKFEEMIGKGRGL